MSLRLAGELSVDWWEQPVDDDTPVFMGADKDIAQVLRSTPLAADEELAGVIVGTSVHHAYAANTRIMSNITPSGDMAWLVNRGGNSEQFMFMDASAGVFYITPLPGGLVLGLEKNAPAPDQANSVLIWHSSSGDTFAVTYTMLTLERSDTAYISFLAPTSGGLIFGDVADDDAGRIIYTHADDSLEFWTAGTQRLDYKATTFAFQESTTVSSTGTLTINAFTLGGALTANLNNMVSLNVLEGRTDATFHVRAAASADPLNLTSWRTAANAGVAIRLQTYSAGDAESNRLTITGGVTTAVATWSAVTHTGLVLSGSMTVNDTLAINTGALDNDYYTLGAVDNDDQSLVVCIRLVGAAEPHALLTRAKFVTSVHAADVGHRGYLYYTEGAGGVADKLYCIMKGAGDAYTAVQVAIG